MSIYALTVAAFVPTYQILWQCRLFFSKPHGLSGQNGGGFLFNPLIATKIALTAVAGCLGDRFITDFLQDGFALFPLPNGLLLNGDTIGV